MLPVIEFRLKRNARTGLIRKRDVAIFCERVYDHYRRNKRSFPWRDIGDPYKVAVSEIMLQQTPVDRVVGKYETFVEKFPTVDALAQASLRDVLAVWSGLGYNRRARALCQLAQRVVHEFDGKIPRSQTLLQTFPSIGPATAASTCAFAFNLPTVFIETNIRSVFIHCFFSDGCDVKDADLLPLIEQTLDRHNPRKWYYALMDYGVMVKKLYRNPSRKSAHHVRQSNFIGSDRQIRGRILKVLIDEGAVSFDRLGAVLEIEKRRLCKVLNSLEKDQMITGGGVAYRLADVSGHAALDGKRA